MTLTDYVDLFHIVPDFRIHDLGFIDKYLDKWVAEWHLINTYQDMKPWFVHPN